MTKKKNDELLDRLAKAAVTGPAGKDQAKRAIEEKQRRAKRKKAAPAAEGQGRSASIFRYPDDDRLILHLQSELADRGIRANDSQIIRAGLRALDQMHLDDAEKLVIAAAENDRRRR